MIRVYVVSSGCVYEGGSVNGVFIKEDLAKAKYNELREEHLEMGRSMEDYENERGLSGKSRKTPGYWLTEEIQKDLLETTSYFQTDYVTLAWYDCEE